MLPAVLTSPRGSGDQCSICLKVYVQPSIGDGGFGKDHYQCRGEGDTSQGCPAAPTRLAPEEAGIYVRKNSKGVRSLAVHKSDSSCKCPSKILSTSLHLLGPYGEWA